MNKVFLIGNLTKDTESGTTNNGINYCRFSIAIQRRFKNADGENGVDFLNIVAWRGLADTCSKYLKKGNKVAIVGNIQNRSYDADDGTKRYVTDIIAEEVEFLTPKGSSEKKEQVEDLQPVDDDTLPF